MRPPLQVRSCAWIILESQFLSIRSRIEEAILPARVPPLQRLVVCSGRSANMVFLQLPADAFNMRVFILRDSGARQRVM